MVAIDTNILIYAHRRNTPFHDRSQSVIRELKQSGRHWGIPQGCIAEFWSVVTRKTPTGIASTPDQAGRFIAQLVSTAGARYFVPGLGFSKRLVDLAQALDVSGVRIFDLQISLSAKENGATEIWTNDRAFIATPGMTIINPFDRHDHEPDDHSST